MPRAARGVRGAGAGGALGVAVLLGVLGCAATPEPRSPAGRALRADEGEGLVREWEATWGAFPGLRAAVDLAVRRNGRNDRAAAVLLLAPAHLRLEVATPFGLPALVATAGPDRITIYHPLERAAWTARPSPQAIARWLGAPVPLETLIGLLVGRVPPPHDPSAVRVEASPTPHLAFERDSTRHRVWVTPQGQPATLAVDAREPFTVRFEWGVNGAIQTLEVTAPSRGVELSIRYLAAEYTAPPPEAFELTLPADVRVESID